jgi:hypothetical protein
MAENNPEAARIPAERWKELRERCAVLVRRAILTLAAVPDPDRKFRRRSPASSLPRPIYTQEEIQAQFDHAARLAASRGEMSTRAARFSPTPRDLDRYLEVWQWIVWLLQQRNGDRDVRILIARAHGAQWWRLGQRYHRGEDAIRRWEKAAIAAITEKFWRDIDRLW